MKKNDYQILLTTLKSLIEDEVHTISLLANTTAIIKMTLPAISWVGFYLLQNKNLILGPFQGRVACNSIPLGRGVCGKSALSKQTIIVKDVHTFPDHIACDSASNSEIVIPIFIKETLYGVLDLDSTKFARFTKTDQIFLEEIAKEIGYFLEKINK